jgi:hypothetical protein
LIGVIANKSEKEIIREFFELFKTPWEFYHEDRLYDVVLTTVDTIPEINTKLLVIYGSEENKFDRENKIHIKDKRSKCLLTSDSEHFPVYGKVLIFGGSTRSLVRINDKDESAGIEINEKDSKILRIGYDLFREVHFLLSSGQPAEYAYIPTLEIHISMLRNWIVKSGIPLIEIPPVPSGYKFITCLTHDVDFAGIRQHRFDRTMFGFLYRALFGSLIGVLKRRTSWSKLLKNWRAVLLLPGVYLGIVKDFFHQFERYIKLERGLRSTFFIIPYKNKNGRSISGLADRGRAMKYEITDIEPEIQKLVECGFEIGLHGIDAWRDPEKGLDELNRISSTTGRTDIGIRMHWLFFKESSPQLLEKAGFLYDSSFGYNEAIGYRGGTVQAFRPQNVERLLELPLNVMDTALFYRERMGLNEEKAHNLLNKLLGYAEIYGGALTINWHQRSLGPERLWDNFYVSFLEKLKRCNAWFATARDSISWFNKRRAAFFENVEFGKERINVNIVSTKDSSGPDLVLRIYNPEIRCTCSNSLSKKKASYIDISFTGNLKTSFCLEKFAKC